MSFSSGRDQKCQSWKILPGGDDGTEVVTELLAVPEIPDRIFALTRDRGRLFDLTPGPLTNGYPGRLKPHNSYFSSGRRASRAADTMLDHASKAIEIEDVEGTVGGNVGAGGGTR